MSVEAIIIDAQIAEKESTPHLSIISVKEARDAPNDRGRVRIKGKISLGTPNFSSKGANKLEIISVAPDAKSILTPTIKAHIVGKSENADLAPFLAPFKKQLK